MRRFIGEVVSTRMQKTAVVLVERFRKNARLDKWVKYRKKFKVHDEREQCDMGDQVRIRISRPFSKTKSWVLEEILKKSPAVLYEKRMRELAAKGAAAAAAAANEAAK